MTAITSDRQLYHEMSAYLSGNADAESVIAQIVMQADAASVAQNLGADKEGIRTSVVNNHLIFEQSMAMERPFLHRDQGRRVFLFDAVLS